MKWEQFEQAPVHGRLLASKSGRFYPDSVRSAEARLQHYASQFNIVEVDRSYCATSHVINLNPLAHVVG
jgi:uncharacterized protein YecE (DUF72 family)